MFKKKRKTSKMLKGCDYEAGWCSGESTGSRQ